MKIEHNDKMSRDECHNWNPTITLDLKSVILVYCVFSLQIMGLENEVNFSSESKPMAFFWLIVLMSFVFVFLFF